MKAGSPELAEYDAIIFGSGTRFGVVTSQMRNFLDQTSPLWATGAFVGKVGSVFTGSGTQHGGQEVHIPDNDSDFGAPWHGRGRAALCVSGPIPNRRDYGRFALGASTITKPDGSRMPPENEPAGARFRGRHVVAAKLKA